MTVRELINHKLLHEHELSFECIAGKEGLDNVIGDLNINRPGLSLTGYEIDFVPERIQMFGKGESGYLRFLESKRDHHTIDKFFEQSIPCVLFSYSITPPNFFLELCQKYHCPVIQCALSSSAVMQKLTQFIATICSPTKTIHGVLVEVYGLGVLLTGESGIGKSETALALIERGHLLISDDAVRITLLNENVLIGTAVSPELGYHMEIRGLGIINILQLFGIGVVRSRKRIELMIELVDWDNNVQYDRIGTSEKRAQFFNITIPKLTIPVRQGRILPVIIEAAVRNMRLKATGYNAAKEFTKLIHNKLAEK